MRRLSPDVAGVAATASGFSEACSDRCGDRELPAFIEAHIADPPKRKRRCFQFSQRPLMVAVVALVVALAIILPAFQDAQGTRVGTFCFSLSKSARHNLHYEAPCLRGPTSTAWDKGTVPIYSADSTKWGQSPAVELGPPTSNRQLLAGTGRLRWPVPPTATIVRRRSARWRTIACLRGRCGGRGCRVRWGRGPLR
jgi:hypothetical protein